MLAAWVLRHVNVTEEEEDEEDDDKDEKLQRTIHNNREETMRGWREQKTQKIRKKHQDLKA